MFEHFELVEARSSLPEAELIICNGRELIISDDGVVEKQSTLSEVSAVADFSRADRSKFVRLLDESFSDLQGPALEALSKVCLDAHHAGQFFLCCNFTDQLVLRTVIGHEKLRSKAWITENGRCTLTSDISIESNVLPYNPYWSKLRAPVRDEKSMRVHFPPFMLKEAFSEKKTLKTKLFEWRCEIGETGGPVENELGGGSEGEQRRVTRKLFWEIQAADVKHVKDLRSGTPGIKLVTWRGGKFVQKIDQNRIDSELEFVKRFSHPHIVYCFGEPCDGLGSSYFMEYMPDNLSRFIRERVNRGKGPPLSQHESIDVLLQIAEAMRYMHRENVVHCDLKCDNILIREISTLENVKHLLIKVADFGSAQVGNSCGFKPGPGTTLYSAPEATEQRKDRSVVIGEPVKIDVYSFGIVAFEVLTGEDNYSKLCQRSPSKFKKGVIEDNVRPLLDKKFVQNKELISLIVRCWHKDPSERPPFVEICEELKSFMAQEHQFPVHAESHKHVPGADTLIARIKGMGNSLCGKFPT